jgi:hypothetical protein
LLGYVDGLLAHGKRAAARDDKLHLAVFDSLLETVPLATAAFTGRLRNRVEDIAREQSAERRHKALLRRAPLRLAIFFLAMAVFSATPWGRSFAQQITRFFTPATTNVVPEQAVVPATELRTYSSIEDAEKAVGFEAKMPSSLPKGYVLDEIRVNVSEEVLTIFYRGPGNQTPVMTPLMFLTQRRSPFDDLVGPSAAIEELNIAGERAEYVEGGWMYVESAGAGEVKEFRWEETSVPAQSLRWMADGFYFGLSFVGSDTQPGFLGREDLIRVAESLR